MHAPAQYYADFNRIFAGLTTITPEREQIAYFCEPYDVASRGCGTQNNLGKALESPGERESGTADRNAKARITAYAKGWDRRCRQPGQEGGALGRAALDVLAALLWAFHNAKLGCCFPSYERIAEKAGCARSTVAAAIKALEFAGVLRGSDALQLR